ncbi:uracil-DNA glycosylase [soil metagenome]
MSNATDLFTRYLRQRRELGEAEIFLDRLNPEQLQRLLAGRSGNSPAEARDGITHRPNVDEPKPRQPVHTVERQADVAEVRPTAPRAALSTESLAQLATLEELRAAALGCPRCRLCETRHHVVFGEGRTTAELMVIGEAPGAEEDLRGLPFQEKAGELLDLLLATVGFSRDSVYLCTVIKCRPPGNRNPELDEVEACAPYLRRQVELVEPGAILALGGFAAQTLLASTTPLNRLRGGEHQYMGVPLVPSYHPSALIRNRGWIRPVWEDLQRIRSILDRR